MAIAELHGKQGEEDSLTSDVFGAFKYLRPAFGLLPFLAKAEPFNGTNAVARWEADATAWCFWPKTGRREPDLFILLIRDRQPVAAFVVEAKFHAEKHNLPANVAVAEVGISSDVDGNPENEANASTDGDQLADYFCGLIEGKIRLRDRRDYGGRVLASKVRGRIIPAEKLLGSVPLECRYLLYVTAHFATPLKDVQETLASLSARQIPEERGRQLLWINWQSAAASLESLIQHGSANLSDTELELSLDTWALLSKKNLLPFDGWHLLDLANLPVSATTFFWEGGKRFFAGIDASGLKLMESDYFFKNNNEVRTMATGRDIKKLYDAMKRICQESNDMLKVINAQFGKRGFQNAAKDSSVMWDRSSSYYYPEYWLPSFQQMSFAPKGTDKGNRVIAVNVFFDDPKGRFENAIPFVTCGVLSRKDTVPLDFWKEFYGVGWSSEESAKTSFSQPLYTTSYPNTNRAEITYYFLPLDVITSEQQVISLIVEPLVALYNKDNATVANLIGSAGITLEQIAEDTSA